MISISPAMFCRVTACLALLTAVSGTSHANAEEGRPEKILILVADDLGWNDVGYHNPEIRTPNIDALARTGVELDAHYVQPECTPTRVALLTGRYPSRINPRVTSAAHVRALPRGTLTLASMLKSLGYRTAIAGKWHLGSRPDSAPNLYGFDSSYGSLAGVVGMYDHRYRLNTPFTETWHRDGKIIPGYENDRHVTDLVTDEAVRWIEEQAQEPWFLYVPFHAVHTPIAERDEQWLKLNEHIASHDRRIYAAAVSHMDSGIGWIMEALQRTNQLQRTLIIFFSDNGAPINHRGGMYPAPDPQLRQFSSNSPLRGKKAQLYEGGCRVPAFVVWPQRLRPHRSTRPMHVVDWMPTIAALVGHSAEDDAQWDGVDVWQTLGQENSSPRERPIYLTWHAQRRWEALRHGQWKIVRQRDRPWELYNLRDDPGEKLDQADDNPEKLAELLERFERERAKDTN